MVKTSSLQDKIEKVFSQMSGSQKKTAYYLLENYDKAAFLTAAKMGKEVGVSESTIVRFASLLGYNGFPELQESLQNMVKKQLTTVNQLKSSINKVYKGKNVLYQILQSDIENLEKTMNEISAHSFEKIISYILNADVIYIVGLRTATSVSLFFYQALSLFLSNVRSITSFGMEDLFERIADINNKDLLIAISFPRYTRRTVEILDLAIKKGAKTVAITDNIISPIAQKSDIALIARSNLNSFVNSFTAPLSVINAIVTAVSIKKGKQTFEKLSKLEEIWDEYNIFY
jgi:DNA-binding MurR/RpiR family transcriptional regulator